MKLSTDTIDILKNFATINPNLVVTPSEDSEFKISTIAEAKNILASAKISESFPRKFGIYDLNEFLSVLSLFGDDLELAFEDSYVGLKKTSYKCKYHYADPSILTSPEKSISMPSTDIEVNISGEHLNQIRRAAGILGHSTTSLRGNDGTIEFCVIDPGNTTANEFSIVIDESNSCKSSFDLQFLIANLKVLAGDYKVELSSKLISHWINQGASVEYYIALEKTSTFE